MKDCMDFAWILHRGENCCQQIHAFFVHFSRHRSEPISTLFCQEFAHISETNQRHLSPHPPPRYSCNFHFQKSPKCSVGSRRHAQIESWFHQFSKRAGKWPKKALCELLFRPKKAHKPCESNGDNESPFHCMPKQEK